jgi:hypothetical protein
MLIPPNGKNLILFFVVKVYCGKQSATYHWYFVNNDEWNIEPYVSDYVGFGLWCVY